ncbi:flagellar protein FlaG [Methylomonas sp. LL1]|uniref:flagellar protein FlaG n=1 Tax=Methylomonas sp. LL1 TaxID=2785785 RepID=UPI0018C3EAD2|nr:flagellar protein FlaG [Methylomonas sp. LL1]QPK65684.1 flagellar protein FlaG [Methylomonas sp. LL1]
MFGGGEEAGGLVVSFVSSPQDNKPVSTVNQNEKSEQETSPELVKEAVDQGNSLLQMAKRNLQFKVDEETNEQVVKIVDSDSGEVVRQIPTEEMLAFIRRMQELEGLQGSVLQDRA